MDQARYLQPNSLIFEVQTFFQIKRMIRYNFVKIARQLGFSAAASSASEDLVIKCWIVGKFLCSIVWQEWQFECSIFGYSNVPHCNNWKDDSASSIDLLARHRAATKTHTNQPTTSLTNNFGNQWFSNSNHPKQLFNFFVLVCLWFVNCQIKLLCNGDVLY